MNAQRGRSRQIVLAVSGGRSRQLTSSAHLVFGYCFQRHGDFHRACCTECQATERCIYAFVKPKQNFAESLPLVNWWTPFRFGLSPFLEILRSIKCTVLRIQF